MGFKRKRAADDSPLSVGSFGGFVPTPEEQSPSPFLPTLDSMADMGPVSGGSSGAVQAVSWCDHSDWGNRTRKRFRDNRPDERVIHENTLNKLFAAQRDCLRAEPILSDSLSTAHLATYKPQRSTLHSFWKQLPTPQPRSPAFEGFASVQKQAYVLCCDDCDALLRKDDAMVVDMNAEINASAEDNAFACSDCGKTVCATCAVVVTRRHCLQCATHSSQSRRWW